MRSKRQRDGYTWPGHNFLGPGNTVYKSDAPTDDVDLDALIHDLKYELATNPEEIRQADRDALHDFVNDYEKNGEFAELAGIIGIGIKYGFESLVGVQYPRNMSGPQNLSQYIYAEREKHLAEEWKRARQNPENNFRNYSDFKANALISKQIYKEYKVGGYYYNQHLERFNAETHHNTASTSAGTHHGPPAKRPRGDEDTDTASEGDISARNGQNPTNTGAADNNNDIVMQENIGQQSGSGRGPNSGARSGASGNNSSVGAVGSSIPNITWIRPSKPCESNTIHFSKTRIMVSYGYSTENIQSSETIDQISTPLALIPVDYLPFYISEAEYNMLPTTSKVIKVNCSVTPLGTRTAFDTGTTLSGTATSEYVPIGLVAEGLNKSFYGKNCSYTVSATDAMKVNGIEDINIKEMKDKYYNHISSNALCVPQNITEYYVHEWNRSSNPDTTKYTDYLVHNKGCVRMDEKVHQFLINQAVGQPIANYEYVTKSGIIKKGKEHYVPYTRKAYKIHSNKVRPYSAALQFFKANNKIVPGDIGIDKTMTAPAVINNIDENYCRTIESYGTYHPNRGGFGYDAQPQLHVGIIATPQLKPSENNITYLNSACYWKIECSIEISFNISSCFGKGSSVSWPLEVELLTNWDRGYTTGETLFGMTDDKNGRLTNKLTDIEDEDDDDDYELIKRTKRIIVN